MGRESVAKEAIPPILVPVNEAGRAGFQGCSGAGSKSVSLTQPALGFSPRMNFS